MITFQCPCGKHYSADEQYAGKVARCKNCGRVLTIGTEAVQSGTGGIQPPKGPTRSYWRSVGKEKSPALFGPDRMSLRSVITGVLVVLFLLMIFIVSQERSWVQGPAPDLQKHAGDGLQRREETARSGASIVPVNFRLGTFDNRFGISTNEFLEIVNQAKLLWEQPSGRVLFRYDSSASFRINLVFDERQQRIIDEKRLRSQLDATGSSFDQMNREYESELERKNRIEGSYHKEVAAFNARANTHKSRVSHWNDKGGAPAEVFASLRQEEEELKREASDLESEGAKLDEAVARVNKLAAAINKQANDHNLQIAFYNGQYVNSREFEKGVFNGREINIYEFDGDEDLKATMVHELGHALGFGHVDDPAAIMYYRLEKQDLRNLHLTVADLKLLYDKFPVTIVATH
jgi:hypothetical protein